MEGPSILNSLPCEIHLHIADFQDVRSLYKLFTTCKALYAHLPRLSRTLRARHADFYDLCIYDFDNLSLFNTDINQQISAVVKKKACGDFPNAENALTANRLALAMELEVYFDMHGNVNIIIELERDLQSLKAADVENLSNFPTILAFMIMQLDVELMNVYQCILKCQDEFSGLLISHLVKHRPTLTAVHNKLLIYTAANNMINAFETLMALPTVDPMTERGRVLQFVCRKGYDSILTRILNDSRVSIDFYNRKAIIDAAASGHGHILRSLLAKSDAKLNDCMRSAIGGAASGGSSETLRILLGYTKLLSADILSFGINAATAKGHVHVLPLLTKAVEYISQPTK